MSEHKLVASYGDSRPRLSVERSSTFFFRHDLQLSHYLIPGSVLNTVLLGPLFGPSRAHLHIFWRYMMAGRLDVPPD